MENDKWIFVENMIMSSSIGGAFLRGNIYESNIRTNDKDKFKELLKEKLREYIELYKNKVNSEQHIKNIKKLSEEISRQQQEILQGGCFRIGTTQKVLNLYLKYLWVLGEIPKPPHCPFDSIIIDELGLSIKWTELNDIEIYEQQLVKEVDKKAKAENLSIAEWELKFYNQIIKNNFKEN